MIRKEVTGAELCPQVRATRTKRQGIVIIPGPENPPKKDDWIGGSGRWLEIIFTGVLLYLLRLSIIEKSIPALMR